MGKASKWLRNLLIGKKDEKNNKESSYISAEILADVVATPKEKRRWSFGRSASADISGHKSSKSFDTIVTSHQVTKALLDFGNGQNRTKSIEAKPAASQNEAATKIQAFFRSYLARRALVALRGLVKLQALVRGYLVRKRATATLRCMHALIAIQVRARVHRVKMATDQEGHLQTRLRPATHKSSDINQLQIYHNRPAIDDTSSRNLGPQYEKYSLASSSQRSSQHNSPISKTNYQIRPHFYIDHFSQLHPWLPSYMANTESSRAKARSQSEPKQRPKTSVKQKGRRSTSSQQIDIAHDIHMQRSSSRVGNNDGKNQHPWLLKLYRSTKKGVKDSECETMNMNTSDSCKSLIAYEPPLSLY